MPTSYAKSSLARLYAKRLFQPEKANTYNKRADLRFELGEFETAQNNTEKAERYYRTAIDDYTEAIRRMPTSYAKSSLARLYAKRLFQPEKANTYNKRADLRFELGEFETAQNNTEKAERYYRTAIDDYTEAINLRSDHAVVYYSRGLAKRALGLHGEAKADFEKSAELNREIEDSHDD
jgi:tetratricopeptide (TPR) repeat protein